ncbi:testin isoform X2 [Adelges cooleyi]|nr:testin isoform X2 [Adelges cooleyi]
MIIKPDDQMVKVEETDRNQNTFKFDWVPPNINKDLASEYMQLLPSNKLPISGSEGALYRRQQLERQVPLHDFNANVCHELTAEEENAMSFYLEDLKKNALGQGLIKKLADNTNPLPLFKNLNLAPKPFKKNQLSEDEEFPPPPPELLYPCTTDLKTPHTFIQNKNYSKGDNMSDLTEACNPLDNVNNNTTETGSTVLPAKQSLNTLTPYSPQQLVSHHAQNDNFKPAPYDGNSSIDILKNKKEFMPSHNDMYIVPEGRQLFCKQCNDNVYPGQVAVLAERTGKDVLWHPSCFVCTTCKELLVDLVYFFHQDNVYCGRHYAETLNIPRCLACDELIFLKEYTIAENHTFHVRHFCCFECDKPLAGLEYVQIENQPVCLDCYQFKYGKKCETCRKNIVAGDSRIGWKDLSWHESPACFKCYQCYTSLLGKKFMVKDEKRPLCSRECVIAYNNSTEI